MKINDPKHWSESPCEHAWVLEHGGTAFCRMCGIDRPEVKSAAVKAREAYTVKIKSIPSRIPTGWNQAQRVG